MQIHSEENLQSEEEEMENPGFKQIIIEDKVFTGTDGNISFPENETEYLKLNQQML